MSYKHFHAVLAVTLLQLLPLPTAAESAQEIASEAGDPLGDLDDQCIESVWYAVQQLQPWYRRAPDAVVASRRAAQLRDLTDAICAASTAYDINPLLAVAVAFRESSLLPQVGLGGRNGARGERGYFQVMPGGAAEAFRPGECSQHEPRCNAFTALGYMASLRQQSSLAGYGKGGLLTWVYLGAYGRSTGIPSLEEAVEFTELHRARATFCRIEEECDEVWPTAVR
jgi:hypothetical protein